MTNEEKIKVIDKINQGYRTIGSGLDDRKDGNQYNYFASDLNKFIRTETEPHPRYLEKTVGNIDCIIYKDNRRNKSLPNRFRIIESKHYTEGHGIIKATQSKVYDILCQIAEQQTIIDLEIFAVFADYPVCGPINIYDMKNKISKIIYNKNDFILWLRFIKEFNELQEDQPWFEYE
jgi:hypothetical protein